MTALSTIIAGIGVGISAAATAGQFHASAQQAGAQKQAIAAQQEAERQRQIAMNLDAARKQREISRQAQVARAQALATTTSQGASQGSGLEGAYGAISGQSGVNQTGVTKNLEIGNNIFAANAAVGAARSAEADAGAEASLFGGISSLGGSLVKNSGTLGKIGEYAGLGKAY